MLVFILVAILVLYALSYVLPVGIPKGSVYGSSYFSKNQKRTLAKGKQGLVIDGRRRLSLKSSFQHLILVAPTGFGKTVRFVLNNVLTLDNCSQLVTDTKGELLLICRPALEKKGYTVRVLDFRDPSNSIQFNPLLLLNTVTEIKEFCNALYAISNSNRHSESAIWAVGACRILEVLIRALLAFPNAKIHTMGSLIYLLNRMKSQEVTDFVKRYGDKETIQLYEYIITQEPKIFYGQLSTAQASVAAFDTKEIKQIMARTTFEFSSLRKQRTVLFLVLPVGVSDKFNVVLSLFYTQLFRYLLNTPLEKEDLSVFTILEEFGMLKRLPDYQRTIALIRSQRVSISMILQNLEQLRQVYGSEGMNTILSNSSSFLCFAGIRERTSLEFVSMLLGKTTRTILKPTAFSSFSIEKRSKNLLELDEIRTLDSNKAIFIHGNEQAQIIKPIPIYKNRALMQENGIASVDGQLVVVEEDNLSALPSDQVEEEDHLLDLEGLVVTNETADFKERLNDILS